MNYTNEPTRIWLQTGTDEGDMISDFKELDVESISWCEDRIFENDIEFINRRKTIDMLFAYFKITNTERLDDNELRKALEDITNFSNCL